MQCGSVIEEDEEEEEEDMRNGCLLWPMRPEIPGLSSCSEWGQMNRKHVSMLDNMDVGETLHCGYRCGTSVRED